MDQLFLFSVSLGTFIQAIAKQGGMSMTNGYDVDFVLPSSLNTYLNPWIGNVMGPTNGSNQGGLIKMLCDEAQLPNVQAATGQMSGRFLGESQINYAYSKFYSDLSLTWMCDADRTPLKFVTGWHSYIFNGGDPDDPKTSERGLSKIKAIGPRPLNRAVRLEYPEQYMCTEMRITKTEKNGSAPNGRASVCYILQNAYPYSIDSVPLSYGTSQITKVTANFYYQKHTVVFGDGTK